MEPDDEVSLLSISSLRYRHPFSGDKFLVERGNHFRTREGDDSLVEGGDLQGAIGQCVGQRYLVGVDQVVAVPHIVGVGHLLDHEDQVGSYGVHCLVAFFHE